MTAPDAGRCGLAILPGMPRAFCHLLLTWLLLSLQLATACTAMPAAARAAGTAPMACAEAATMPAHMAHAPAGQRSQAVAAGPALAPPPCAQLSHCSQCTAVPPALTPGVVPEPVRWLPLALSRPPAPAAGMPRPPSATRAGPPVPDRPLFLRTARLRL